MERSRIVRFLFGKNYRAVAVFPATTSSVTTVQSRHLHPKPMILRQEGLSVTLGKAIGAIEDFDDTGANFPMGF
jgi:hypothetical protein